MQKDSASIIKRIHMLKISRQLMGKMEGLHAIGVNPQKNSFCRFMHGIDKKLIPSKKDQSNNQHLKNYCFIAVNYPRTVFALWSKRKDIIKQFFDKHEKPRNLILIYSNPLINKPITKIFGHFDKIFNIVKKENFKNKHNCGAKCAPCLKCYTHSKKEDSNIIYEVEKNKTNNKVICKDCYSFKSLKYLDRTLRPFLDHNTKILSNQQLTTDQVPIILQAVFRFNHHGEILEDK